jgi:hypothetical protein
LLYNYSIELSLILAIVGQNSIIAHIGHTAPIL